MGLALASWEEDRSRSILHLQDSGSRLPDRSMFDEGSPNTSKEPRVSWRSLGSLSPEELAGGRGGFCLFSQGVAVGMEQG